MDLELGFKLTRTAGDFSSTNFQLLKDRGGPLFQSTETNNMFILTAHLTGYMRGDIKIEINEDGTELVIGGEKPVKETVMVGWRLYKKGIEIRKFRKTFRIPDGVVLDKIKAKFDEDESVLTVSMPKRVKGMVETVIEEMEEPELAGQGPENLPVLPDEIPESSREPNHVIEEHSTIHESPRGENELMPEQVEPKRDQTGDQAEPSGTKQQTEEEDLPESYEVCEDESGSLEEESPSPEAEAEEGDRTRREEEEEPRKKCKILCTPIVAGSALLLSFVVFVIQFIRSKNQPSKTKS